jgi:hypothetical protein
MTIGLYPLELIARSNSVNQAIIEEKDVQSDSDNPHRGLLGSRGESEESLSAEALCTLTCKREDGARP